MYLLDGSWQFNIRIFYFYITDIHFTNIQHILAFDLAFALIYVTFDVVFNFDLVFDIVYGTFDVVFDLWPGIWPHICDLWCVIWPHIWTFIRYLTIDLVCDIWSDKAGLVKIVTKFFWELRQGANSNVQCFLMHIIECALKCHWISYKYNYKHLITMKSILLQRDIKYKYFHCYSAVSLFYYKC